MKKLLIGTGNKGKQKEYKKIREKLGITNIEFVFPEDFGILDEPEETGKTFEENALLKAKFYFEKTKIPCISDDGGLEIEILNNEPGVKSNRWKGYKMTDEEIVNYTLERLSQYKDKEQRKAKMKLVIAYYDGKLSITKLGFVTGHIALKPLMNFSVGYPHRGLFIVEDTDKYYQELTPEEHSKYNHREKAFIKLIRNIKNII